MAERASRAGPLRRLYDGLLGWAETPYGGLVLFLWAFLESSVFPIPPDAFLIAMVLGARSRAWRFALIASVASVLGGVAGYGVGHWLWWSGPGELSQVAQLFFDRVPGFTVEKFERVQAQYESWGFWVVFTAGFTPLPYKVITISAGAFDISFAVFVAASMLSRSARFFLVAGLLWRYGEPVRDFIDRRFDLLAVLFVVLLLGGIYAAGEWF